MFSHYLKCLLERLHFFKIVITRFLLILFRRRKGIELLSLDYNSEHLFENSFILINYRFKNAIYYQFGNHTTLEKKVKIFNLSNFEKDFKFTVYGFFRKKTYHLKFQPILTLESEKFRTSFSNFNILLEEQFIPNLSFPIISLKLEEPVIRVPKLEVSSNTIKIKINSFNQNDYI